MIDTSQNFTICPDESEAKQGCEFCKYEDTHDYRCMIFDLLGEKRLSYRVCFCPLTGELKPGWEDKPSIYAVWLDGTKNKVKSIDDIKQKQLFTFEALCIFEDEPSTWVPFKYIKNEEEI